MRDNSFREQRKELRRQRRQIRREQMQYKRHGSVLAGLVVLGVGTVFLLKEMNFQFPAWLFTWPMILVVFGLFAGAGNSFRDPGWLFISGAGVIFVMRKIWPEVPVWNYTWPVIVIIIGLMMMLAPRRNRFWKHRRNDPTGDTPNADNPNPDSLNATEDITCRVQASDTHYWKQRQESGNWLDVVSVFGNIKKQVYTKDFKGGDIVSIFGGAEINLMHADFEGSIHIEMVQVFGGAKLIVPPHWQIRSDMAAIFGGIEDKRTPQVNYDANKIVVLNGMTLFGGIEIKSY